MAKTVDSAFMEFMRDIINLEPDITRAARSSRDNLLSNISEFDDKDDFFDLCQEYNVHFGSFARRTKCRELDDIDLMIGVAANGATYNSNDPWHSVNITASKSNAAQVECTNSDYSGTLNSTLVLNRFKREVSKVREYRQSDVGRDGSAVVLDLKTKDWSFDIVPCFHTVAESDGRSYFLIPNGKGKWKKTEPKIEQARVTAVNQKHGGLVLETIRLIKYWNRRGRMPTMVSYVIETMVIDYFEGIDKCSEYLERRFRDVLCYIANNIFNAIHDSKRIEGNINTLDYYQKQALQQRANSDAIKATNAITAECGDERNHAKAINIWRDVFGGDFPAYV